MGDLIGDAVSGTLFYVPKVELDRARAAMPAAAGAAILATLCRINALYMIARAGSGHIGSSFSSMDIMTWVYGHVLRGGGVDASAPCDQFFSSKGHDAPALYSVLLAHGKLPFDLIHSLRRQNGLPGHPDVDFPGVVANTGSLGMGVSKAKGLVHANRQQGRAGDVYVLTGDGELQEGQFWESLLSARNMLMSEVTVIVDHNKLQSDTFVERVSSLGDLEAKFQAFGAAVFRCDGNDVSSLDEALRESRDARGVVRVIIADTVKGKGVSFMEHTALDSDVEMYKFHSGAPSADLYAAAVEELLATANSQLAACGMQALQLESVARPEAPAAGQVQRLVPAYSMALREQARKNRGLIALDADLVVDTGLLAFRDEFPERFVECGIAEQDMVSEAGGMALGGLFPIVHSFACFLTARANEQIYNNASERKHILYVGSLAGVIPGGPGHSHQGIRDIASLKGVPGLVMAEPSCEAEVPLLLDWFCNAHKGSGYLRLTSVAVDVPFDLPSTYRVVPGRGVSLVAGEDVAIIAYGPVMLSSAVRVAARLSVEAEISARVINLPWLNHVDVDWLRAELGRTRKVLLVDNHYLQGGQGETLRSALCGLGDWRIAHLGVDRIPAYGTNDEVLGSHGLSSEAMYDAARVLAAT